MTEKLVHGSGNVYRDFGHADAGLRQARAIVAAKIISLLDERELSTRDAERLTGVSHSNSLVFATHSYAASHLTG